MKACWEGKENNNKKKDYTKQGYFSVRIGLQVLFYNSLEKIWIYTLIIDSSLDSESIKRCNQC